MGAWIETKEFQNRFKELFVAPLVGAWIETDSTVDINPQINVAPLVGAWIETVKIRGKTQVVRSHPSWVRGLKPIFHWIILLVFCRTPRGCVD